MLHSLTLCKNNEPFLNWTVMCSEKWILYDSWWGPAQWLDGEEAPKHFPRSKIAPKQCLVVCCPSDPLQISESRWNCYIWEVCSSNQHNAPKTAMPAVTIVQQGPILHDNAWLHIEQPTLQKLNELGYKVLPHTHIHLASRQPTATFLIISLTFCRENAFITSRRHKMLSKSSTPEAWIVMLQNKQMYLSLAKMYWLWWFIFWLIKVCLSLFIII